ncbi:MAG: D-amino acid dehydrogenase [Polaromonas sp.]|uniref:D-amino acid dehydrogenase n=1 Tax=Polaromonas sp. TaxID=1869339 RepID=UPI00272EEBB6|nr:D-amino acid dehydrogenase [Polaromonas sp.]MDP1742067.1 D-amino acid dehydrogenase [Polaromonas sp.]MDP1952882.1 D-amino acid dehydrogenase [Polaromonas sp.]MDP3356577.1 D-amino acid dehydrogenase [Polaromonas sp.]MDP3755629.1 D-amino acid dehydrogenase [Polaromonas sp.]
MKLAVIGAGIIGITTAWELASDGHEVTVFERRGAAAEESSFANAGVIAPGYVTPWAAPGMPAKVIGHLLGRHAPVRLSLPLTGSELAWMWKWWRACKLETYMANRARLQRLAFYSRQRLHQITADQQLEYDRSSGYMVLLRAETDARMVEPGLQVLRDAGVAFRQVGSDEARKLEPALNPHTPFLGAIHLPDDEVANCRQFALLLKAQAQQSGVSFEFNKAVAHLDLAQPATFLIAGETAQRRFDAVVLCAGLHSAALLGPLGIKIPMAAVYGYSISASIREPLNAPRSALMDERYKVAISRLGNRVRVAGSAEIGGAVDKKRASSLQTLYKVLQDWFPGAAQTSNSAAHVQEWKGARPMLPDGPPILGASGLPGLWLNLGHGSSGWALSCGSARVISDLIAARTPEIDMEGLGMDRLHRPAR